MADVEKVVLVKADVISNFIKTKKELDGVKTGYDNYLCGINYLSSLSSESQLNPRQIRAKAQITAINISIKSTESII
jgi:hypothetical protein